LSWYAVNKVATTAMSAKIRIPAPTRIYPRTFATAKPRMNANE
jgi:hypothetical protein